MCAADTGAPECEGDIQRCVGLYVNVEAWEFVKRKYKRVFDQDENERSDTAINRKSLKFVSSFY